MIETEFIVTPKHDLVLGLRSYKKGELYRAVLMEYPTSKMARIYVDNMYSVYSLEDFEGLFIDVVQLREEKLKELGI